MGARLAKASTQSRAARVPELFRGQARAVQVSERWDTGDASAAKGRARAEPKGGLMLGMTRRWGLVLAVVLAAGVAGAQEWETVATTPYLIKVRPRPGTKAKDIWAEGELKASA